MLIPIAPSRSVEHCTETAMRSIPHYVFDVLCMYIYVSLYVRTIHIAVTNHSVVVMTGEGLRVARLVTYAVCDDTFFFCRNRV